ncbi:MAG: hypothetical protein K2N63_08360 [Lachnospiraceae bacterium]|nr:hypothetical protein [Lachnospiraceae bacterium]
MKDDKEFIAGIYQKAEERKREEEMHTGHGHHLFAWRSLAVAACLCLIVSGAVYAGNRKETPQEDYDPGNSVMALSMDDPGIPAANGDMSGSEGMRARMSGEDGISDSPNMEGTDTYQSGAQGVGEAKKGKSAALQGFWAGHELACSMMDQAPSAKNGMKMQEAGGNQ